MPKSKTVNKSLPPDRRTQRYFPGDPAVNLLNAATDWVRSRGGDVLVIGGVEVQRWPEDLEFTFRVAVRCTGRSPVAVPSDDAAAVTNE
jgi:hypothetical protein